MKRVARITYLENGVEKTAIVECDRNPLAMLENPAIIEVEILGQSGPHGGQKNNISRNPSSGSAHSPISNSRERKEFRFAPDQETAVLFAALFVLNLLDAVLTFYAVNAGIAYELNPFYNPYDPLPFGKLVAPLLFMLGWVFYKYACSRSSHRLAHHASKVADYMLYFLVGLYVAVVANNIVALVTSFL